MRLVRYEDGDAGIALDLHPRVTVVAGLPPEARARLLAAIAALPSGTDPGATGSVEVHGVYLDLTQESLDLLDLADDLDVVLRRDDLLERADGHDGGRGLPAAGPAGLDRGAEPDGGAASPGANGTNGTAPAALAELEAEVVRWRDQLAEASRVLDEAELARVDVRLRLSAIFDERAGLTADLESARAGLDPTAETRLRLASEELDSLRRRRTATAAETLSSRRRALEVQLEALVADADQQRRELKRLGARDTTLVREALEVLRRALAPASTRSAEAVELAAELAASADRLESLRSKSASGRSQLQELTARRDTAYDELVAAEAALRSPELDEDVVAELEATHDEIFELDGRISKLSSSRLRRRMIQLREREEQLLAKLGFDTWSSYVMGNSTEVAEVERKRRYEVAKATYEFAEDEVAKAASTPILAGSELADAERSHEGLLERAAALLDRDEVALDARLLDDLRSLTVERAGGEVAAAMEGLRGALEGHSADPPPDDPPAAVEATDRWLAAEEASIAEQIGEVEAARQRIEAEMGRLAADLDALGDPSDARPPEPAEDPELAAAAAAVAEAEAAAARHRDAQRLVDELRRRDAELRRAEEELEASSDAAEAVVREAARAVREVEEHLRQAQAALDAAQADHDRTTASAALARASEDRRAMRDRREREAAQRAAIDRLEWYVLARLAQQRSLSYVGSVPLAIDDAFADWSLDEVAGVLERLARMSDVIQVVYLTDDVEVLAWARDLGRERASVVDLTPVG
jgi:hypothetical protein